MSHVCKDFVSAYGQLTELLCLLHCTSFEPTRSWDNRTSNCCKISCIICVPRLIHTLAMVTFNIAYTAPVNPPGTTPALTPGQIWKGLQRKIRRAQDFVPVITECEVLSETRGGEEVLRRVRFAEGHGPPGWVEERCVEYAPIKVRNYCLSLLTIGRERLG